VASCRVHPHIVVAINALMLVDESERVPQLMEGGTRVGASDIATGYARIIGGPVEVPIGTGVPSIPLGNPDAGTIVRVAVDKPCVQTAVCVEGHVDEIGDGLVRRQRDRL